jgi:hypothetical protein
MKGGRERIVSYFEDDGLLATVNFNLWYIQTRRFILPSDMPSDFGPERDSRTRGLLKHLWHRLEN